MRGTLAEIEKDWLDESTAPPMARLLKSLNNKEYAKCVFAYTSLYILGLTAASEYERAQEHDSITIHFDIRSELFHITFLGEDITESARYRCHESQVDSLMDALVFRLVRMASVEREPRPRKPVELESAFKAGQEVKVVRNEWNHTPRSGRIQEVIYHYKAQRYYYHIESGGKRIKKRYFTEDLELAW
jgi:hypothetical protein